MKNTIKAHRKPTNAEIKFGYGAIHYAEFDRDDFLKSDGSLKKWIVSKYDGLRYYR